MELKFANGEIAHIDEAIMGLVDRERMWSYLLKTETTCRMLPTTCGTTAEFLVIEYHGAKDVWWLWSVFGRSLSRTPQQVYNDAIF